MAMHEFNNAINTFEIDPRALEAGLNLARKGKYSSIRIRAHDYIDKNVFLDVEQLSEHNWIKKIIINAEIQVEKKEFYKLEKLSELEELTLLEHKPLDYGNFPNLKKLVLIEGSNLIGIDRLKTLDSIYLIKWKKINFPKNIINISAKEVRISASKKLENIDEFFQTRNVTSLYLQSLPNLKVNEIFNQLKSLHSLKVEDSGWTNFDFVSHESITHLFSKKIDSLSFISKLPHLEYLGFLDCVDGNMQPILDHSHLKKVGFTPNRKHYSHTEEFLNDKLAQKK